mmetsp:Transcript_44080/g.79301  ORF Transcript_44080/g.79301 Transcript_44080/m.79301 type:complete len:207 (+) Transcript_44080:360-980(+)
MAKQHWRQGHVHVLISLAIRRGRARPRWWTCWLEPTNVPINAFTACPGGSHHWNGTHLVSMQGCTSVGAPPRSCRRRESFRGICPRSAPLLHFLLGLQRNFLGNGRYSNGYSNGLLFRANRLLFGAGSAGALSLILWLTYNQLLRCRIAAILAVPFMPVPVPAIWPVSPDLLDDAIQLPQAFFLQHVSEPAGLNHTIAKWMANCAH